MTFIDQLSKLGFKTYEDYLASPHWKDFKNRYRRSGCPKTCAVCDSRHYELHHRTYDRLGCEQLGDVIPLCRVHHEAVHGWLREQHKYVERTFDAVRYLRGRVPKTTVRPPKLTRVKKLKVPKPPKALCKGCGRQKPRKTSYYCTPCLELLLPKKRYR